MKQYYSSYFRFFVLLAIFCVSALGFSDTEGHFDVVVVGAGPAGLSAAIAAKIANPSLKVLVLEKRDLNNSASLDFQDNPLVQASTKPQGGDSRNKWGTRFRDVIVEKSAEAILQSYGVDRAIAPLSHNSVYTGNPKHPPARSQVDRNTGLNFFGRSKAGFSGIYELENLLLWPAVQRQVHFKFSSHIEFLDAQTQSLTLNDGSKLNYDYLIAADGANSDTLKLLDIEPTQIAPSTRWVIGIFETTSQSTELKLQLGRNSNELHGIAMLRPNRASIYASPFDLQANVSAESAVLKMAENFGIEGRLTSPPEDFWGSTTRVQDFIVSGNILIIGDAARKIDPLAGVGITLAIEDSLAVGKFFRALNEGQGLVAATTQFASHMNESVKKAKLITRIMNAVKFYSELRLSPPVTHICNKILSKRQKHEVN